MFAAGGEEMSSQGRLEVIFLPPAGGAQGSVGGKNTQKRHEKPKGHVVVFYFVCVSGI